MRVIANPSMQLWDEVVSRALDSTFFHTPTWTQILTRTYPQFRNVTKGFVLADGAVAIVPMIATVERNHYFQWCESIYPGGYGGAVAERKLTLCEVKDIYLHLMCARVAYLHVMGNPFGEHELPPSFARSDEYTHVLELGPGFETIYSNYRDGHKYSVKRAKKLGVEVSIAETEADYWNYYEAYVDSLRRWGDRTLVTYPYTLFQEIYNRRSGHTKLWLAKVRGEVASGCLVFYHNRHVLYWHAATRENYLNHGAGPLLITEILRNACQSGFGYYDFSPSGQLKGVEQYKEGFGAKRLGFGSYVWQANRLYQAYQSLRGGLGRTPSQKPVTVQRASESMAARLERVEG